jgi:hypothetical protein
MNQEHLNILLQSVWGKVEPVSAKPARVGSSEKKVFSQDLTTAMIRVLYGEPDPCRQSRPFGESSSFG